LSGATSAILRKSNYPGIIESARYSRAVCVHIWARVCMLHMHRYTYKHVHAVCGHIEHDPQRTRERSRYPAANQNSGEIAFRTSPPPSLELVSGRYRASRRKFVKYKGRTLAFSRNDREIRRRTKRRAKRQVPLARADFLHGSTRFLRPFFLWRLPDRLAITKGDPKFHPFAAILQSRFFSSAKL